MNTYGKSNKRFGIDSVIILLLLPISLLVQGFLRKKGYSELDPIRVAVLFPLHIVSLAIVIYLRKDLLKNDWRKYKKSKLSIFISLILPFIAKAIVSASKLVIAKLDLTMGQMGTEGMGGSFNPYLFLIFSIIPATIPIIEEIVFRYELHYKHEARGWKSFFLAILSAILFGLLHLANYNFNIVPTIPLMLVALVFSLSYMITDTIWTPIIGHFLYNGVATLGIAILLIVGQLLG